MKKTITAVSMLAVASLGITAANASTITWGGGAGTFTDGVNWTGGTAPDWNNDVAQISAGTATHDGTGGDLKFNGSNAGMIIDGGNYAQSVGNWMDFNGGATLTMTSGSLSGANNVRFRGIGGNAATHSISGASTLTAGQLTFDDQQTVNFTNGATGTFGGINMNVNSNLNITNATISGSNLALNSYGGTSSFVNLFDGGQLNLSGTVTQETLGNGFVNFGSASSTGSVSFSGLNLTQVQDLVTGQKFGIGATSSTAFADYTFTELNGSGVNGVTVTVAVPEPSSTALLGLGGLALILRRRK